MNGFLRKSTASQARLIGPFIDDVDFVTAKTGLTIANTDIKLRANGTTLSNKNSGGGTHQVNGMYSVSWDATDTANVGELFYSVKVADALQVFGTYVVLTEAAYDAMYSTAAKLGLTLGNSPAGTVDDTVAPTTTQFEAADITEATADHYNARVILFTSGALAGQVALITDYALVSGRGRFTVTGAAGGAMTEAPADGDTFIII